MDVETQLGRARLSPRQIVTAMSGLIIAMLNSVHIKDIGAASGTSTFARNMGGSLGISVLGSIYASRLADTMGSPGAGGLHQRGQITPAALHSLPAEIQDLFKYAVTDGIRNVYLWASIIAAAGFVLAWFIKQVPLRGYGPTPAQNAEAVAEELAVKPHARQATPW